MTRERDESLPELNEYDYALPTERIAMHPSAERDGARLLVLPGRGLTELHAHVRDLSKWLQAGDLLVRNATRVLPARLIGRKQTGAAAEALLLGPAGRPRAFRALLKTRGRLREGARFAFGPTRSALSAQIAVIGERGEVVLEFESDESPYSIGLAPLPPYILKARAGSGVPSEPGVDEARYQTVFARVPGSVAAPTAGLHLTPELLAELESRGVAHAEVVLHVAAGTFRPLTADALEAGRLHAETYELPDATAEAVARTRERGGRVIAVGTTCVRVLESCARDDGNVSPGAGETELFLRPGARFRVVDGLLTNFHLPRSSLLLLAAAFAGRERLLAAYARAIEHQYRFYSYGDAMLIL